MDSLLYLEKKLSIEKYLSTNLSQSTLRKLKNAFFSFLYTNKYIPSVLGRDLYVFTGSAMDGYHELLILYYE